MAEFLTSRSRRLDGCVATSLRGVPQLASHGTSAPHASQGRGYSAGRSVNDFDVREPDHLAREVVLRG